MKAKTIFLVIIMLTVSQLAYADYHIQFNPEADRVLHLGGNTLRGNFATWPEANNYWRSQPQWERDHSGIVGYPRQSNTSSYGSGGYSGYSGGGNFQQQMMQGLLNNFMQGFNNGLPQQNNYNAQQQAAAEQAAAQAAAQAEAFRVHQEAVRVARIQRAQHYRAEWDARETEIGDRLGGAFDVTTSGTAFFGRPANPDADTVAAILGQDIGGAEQAPGEAPDASGSDPSVVDLRGSSGVVQLLRQPMPAVINRHSPTITRSTPLAPVVSPWEENWPETESAPDPRSERKLWTQRQLYLKDKVTDLELAYLFMGIKELGGNSVQALASLPDKAKEALDLKKNISEHINEYVKLLLFIAGQATNPQADPAALADLSSDNFQAAATNFSDDAKRGISNNLLINVAPEGPVAETGIGSAQGLISDLQDYVKDRLDKLKWDSDESGG